MTIHLTTADGMHHLTQAGGTARTTATTALGATAAGTGGTTLGSTAATGMTLGIMTMAGTATTAGMTLGITTTAGAGVILTTTTITTHITLHTITTMTTSTMAAVIPAAPALRVRHPLAEAMLRAHTLPVTAQLPHAAQAEVHTTPTVAAAAAHA